MDPEVSIILCDYGHIGNHSVCLSVILEMLKIIYLCFPMALEILEICLVYSNEFLSTHSYWKYNC